MEKRHSASHIDHFEHHGWVLIERLLSQLEIDAGGRDFDYLGVIADLHF